MTGVIYCGDNLEILRTEVAPSSVDLIYIDPPFNSQRTYNLVYKDSKSDAVEEAFKDCWSWEEAAPQFADIVESGDTPKALRVMLLALRDLLIESDHDLLAYMTMMAPRLLALHRALKTTGSMYVHCDPTASHYLKVMLDGIFGGDRFETEIIWQRSTGKALATRRLPNNHDVLLVYRRGDSPTWNADEMFLPYDINNLDEKTAKKYGLRDPDGRRYHLDNLTNPNPDRPNLTYEFLGVKRVWRWTRERMAAAHAAGLVVQPSPGAVPRLKRYLDEQRGKPLGDVWTDIAPLNSQAAERTGYPTQKPLALLERIIRAASNPGDVVLDAFCGCGTTVEAAERFGRRWIGMDIAHKAVDVIRQRFAGLGLAAPQIESRPPDKQAAEALAKRDKLAFERWVVRKLQARKRPRDRGIDGEAMFVADANKRTHVVISVKAGGKVHPKEIRELVGTMTRENADVGVFVCLAEPSTEMRLEATRAGHLSDSDGEGRIPRIQFLTMERLFNKQLPSIRALGRNVTEVARSGAPPTPGTQLSLLAVKDSKPGKLKGKPAKAQAAQGPRAKRTTG